MTRAGGGVDRDQLVTRHLYDGDDDGGDDGGDDDDDDDDGQDGVDHDTGRWWC